MSALDGMNWLRVKLSENLAIPKIEEMLSSDGMVIVPNQSQWQDLAAKLSMLVTSATPSFVAGHSSTIDLIVGKQRELGLLLKTALIKGLNIKVPKFDSMVAPFLCLYDGSYTNQDELWNTAVSGIQKLSNMNLNLLFSFELQLVLGTDVHKDFQERVLGPMTTLFTRCAGACDCLGTLDLVVANVLGIFVGQMIFGESEKMIEVK